MLNLNNMKWTQIKQPEQYLHSDCYRRTGAIYKNHLAFLRDDLSPKGNALCFLNLPPTNKSEWMSFPLEGCLLKSLPENSNLMIYKNLILTLADKEGALVVAAMSLDSFGICAPKWAGEEKSISSLFLKKKESDIAFKIGDQLIHAHKRVLEKRSQYFADKDFKGVVEIQDCEYDIFKEYLHFVYQEAVDISDVDEILKLSSLAINYLQDDLQEKCLNILIRTISQTNVYKIIDFALEKNICKLTPWCSKFFETNLDLNNIAGLIGYLDGQEDSEFKCKLRNIALKFILDSSVEIYGIGGENNNKAYTKFLLKNLDINTLQVFAKGITNYLQFQKSKSQLNNGVFTEQTFESEGLLKNFRQIKEATLKFINENVDTLLASEISKDLMTFVFASLFMNQSGSDITLKVGDHLIPAHKSILMKKSGYFERVFNSGMAESKQDVINIQEDCEYEIFKEYLRFVYQGEIQFKESHKIIKLHALADKYLQEDLCKECANHFSKIIQEDNAFTILDFAHENNLPDLKKRCLEFFRTNVDSVAKLIKLITYLSRQEDLEFKENNQELKIFAIKLVTNDFFKEEGYTKVYEDFLINNIGMDTISILVSFLRPVYQFSESEKRKDSEIVWFANIKVHYAKAKEFCTRTIQLKKAIFSFLQENPKIIETKQISGGYSNDFLRDFSLYLIEKTKQTPDRTMQTETNQNEEKRGNGKKRMEPAQDGTDEENHVLKKTKQ